LTFPSSLRTVIRASAAAGDRRPATPLRRAGWRKVLLQPGESQRVDVEVEPRTLAGHEAARRQWPIAAGDARQALARAANAPVGPASVILPAATLAVDCPDARLCTAPAP